MTKNNLHKKLFLIFVFFLVISANTCFAFEIKPENYPKIPFTSPITEASKLPNFIVYFFALGIYLAGALAVISLAIGGIQLIFSSVSPEARNSAIDKIKSAILGLVLLFASFIIIHTINPNLEKVENTVSLNPLGSLQLVGNKEPIPAPMNLPVLNDVRKNYSAISWKQTTKIINPTTGKEENALNCDKDNLNAVYNVYLYAEENFKNFKKLERLKCGGKDISFSGANSYFIEKELPGVYFFDAPGCKPKIGSDSLSIPMYSAQSIAQWSQKVMSMRIVNGPDEYKGPFFGVIWFNGQDYKTAGGGFIRSEFQHFKFATRPAADNYSECISDSANFGPSRSMLEDPYSFAIYKWAGFNKDKTPNINCSVDLYSKSSWSGGYYNIGAASEEASLQYWQKELAEVDVLYRQNTTIPEEEREQCSKFNTKYRCLQSFEIKGNCLVLVSNYKDDGTYIHGTLVYAQRYPISSRIVWSYENRPEGYSIERGTPELENDYITSGSAYFMEIIPLAETIKD